MGRQFDPGQFPRGLPAPGKGREPGGIWCFQTSPEGMNDFLENWFSLGATRYKFKLFLFAIVFFWVLWKTRNKMRIEGVFVRNPTELIFRILSCLQKMGRTNPSCWSEDDGRTENIVYCLGRVFCQDTTGACGEFHLMTAVVFFLK